MLLDRGQIPIPERFGRPCPLGSLVCVHGVPDQREAHEVSDLLKADLRRSFHDDAAAAAAAADGAFAAFAAAAAATNT